MSKNFVVLMYITEALDVLSTHPTSERVMEKYRDLRRKKCHRCLKQLLQPDQEPELYNRLVAVLVKSNFMKDPTKSDRYNIQHRQGSNRF